MEPNVQAPRTIPESCWNHAEVVKENTSFFLAPRWSAIPNAETSSESSVRGPGRQS